MPENLSVRECGKESSASARDRTPILRFSKTRTETSIVTELTPSLSAHWNPFTLRSLLQMFVSVQSALLATEVCTAHRRSFSVMIPNELHRAELHSFGRCLSGSSNTQIGLALRVNLSRILQNLPLNYLLSDQVQYSVMAYRTSNQAWSTGLDAGTYCK